MYLIKNAIRNIVRSKGKNLLIASIIFVIGLSCCIALSIKQAANTAKEEGMDQLNITATISYDRQAMMQDMQPPSEGSEDESSSEDSREAMREAMQGQNLSLEELQTYAEDSNVNDFYYTSSLSLNSNDDLQAIESSSQGFGGNGGGGMGGDTEIMFTSGDFTLLGYSSYDAMSDFVSGSSSLSDGEYFDLESDDQCIISEDLATYNSISVGDTITLINPNNENETFELTVTGIYSMTSTQGGLQMSDPANQILTNTAVVDSITATSADNSENEDNSSYLESTIQGTYVFSDVAAYEAFSEDVYDLGLSDEFVVQSADVTSYEQSLEPLNNLADYANTFLIVILVIGGVILVVFQLLRIKERTYEIGVLSAIGMNRKKISFQFLSELFIITAISMVLAIGVGSATSVPITNALLENETTTTDTSSDSDFPSGMGGGQMQGGPGQSGGMGMQSTNYIDEVSSATNLTVVIQILGISLLLTILSGGVAILFVLRYDPIKILSQND
ncbi:ABC transporter permease [Breznakia pachnodae]|uniref:ABC transport system permease protein n=1 Tax=Breznakia pachnodae TaxID=265178 RepID=A0ABU0DZ68_9FIRM|nr:ABC transporter permease [Breznakia pachnodae]MDQ0359935.1 putative ABC transport system permease protein [Breznakia pachnodae]